MEPIMVGGGNHLVDYHSSDLFPERWFHLVIVLHASTEQLFDRLTGRNYNEKKRTENLDAEIELICEEEARGAYKEDIILVCENNTIEDMAKIVEQVRSRVRAIQEQKGH
ncbi:transcription initiation factor TFIID subunit 9 [Angomonas deanei]|nr:transcription initiation factor TFIID subunit 9 [Angomonas deanei]|eukprot:EPY42084.1 transcription initiation factor TFIID subunit 9 [Angomonas deanei]